MAKAEPKKPVVKKKSVDEPDAYVPVVGEKFELNGEVIELTSLDPLTATVYRREGGVQTTNDHPLDSLEGAKPLTAQEVYERVF